jgi:acetyl-CoA/propionyl-CoA carboxylase biotin carboxyl carrier protein
VRLDAGYEAGDTISQYYDNLIAKLVVWAEDREGARRRMLRALEETKIEGVATTIPAAVAILSHPDFAESKHSTKWVEETLDLSGLVADSGSAPEDDGEAKVLRTVTAEVDGRRYDLKLWLPDTGVAVVAAGAAGSKTPKRKGGGGGVAAAASGSVTVPMQGTIVKVLVEVGDEVEAGQTVCVLEAMKMENAVNATTSGTVTEVRAAAGDSVSGGDVVVVIE